VIGLGQEEMLSQKGGEGGGGGGGGEKKLSLSKTGTLNSRPPQYHPKTVDLTQ
jgi:hypothetical protein